MTTRIHNLGRLPRAKANDGADIDFLFEILEQKRPHGTKAEKRFRKRLNALLPGVIVDHFGNAFVKIEGKGDNVLWSCHVDTVHYKGGTQALAYESDRVLLAPGERIANCLGADDGAGIWLAVEMIKAGKPGLYVFHRGEECGGLGSAYITNQADFKDISAAIAFDRAGMRSVITHQCTRTCSDEFAQSLVDGLKPLAFECDDTGVFTDTANYVDVIGECTNISVGYLRQHSPRETQDLPFLLALRKALLKLDTSKLTFKRKPGELDPEAQTFWRRGWDMWDENMPWGDYPYTGYPEIEYTSRVDSLEKERQEIMRVIQEKPYHVAGVLQQYGITVDDLG